VRRLSGRGLVWFFCALALTVGGCRRSLPHNYKEVQHLQGLAKLYGRYVQKHQGRTPATPDELKAFAKTLSSSDLTGLGLDPARVDSYFVSPRDNQPYVFRKQGPREKGASLMLGQVILYEQQGGGGKRMVAYETSRVEEVDATRFKELVPAGP
jgi:hypothetical protein